MTAASSGWRKVRFDQMASVVADRVDPADTTVETYVGLEHLDTESLTIERSGHPSDVVGTKFRVRPGQIIFGKRRFYQRKVAVAQFDCICSAHAMVLEERDDVVVRGFLPHFMLSETFVERALAISEGSLSPTIKWKRLAQQEFMLPPRARQIEILEVLRSAEQAVLSARRAQASADALFRSLVLREISTALERRSCRLDQIADIQLGLQLSPDRRSGKSPKPYLRAANVRQGALDTTDVLQMDFSSEEWDRYAIVAGDVLLVEGGEARDVGMSVLVEQADAHRYGMQNTLLRVRGPQGLDSRFLYYALYGLRLGGVFSRMARGTKIKHIGAGRVAKLAFPDVSSSDQARIVELLAPVEAVLRTATRHLSHTKQLRSVLRSRLAGGHDDLQ